MKKFLKDLLFMVGVFGICFTLSACSTDSNKLDESGNGGHSSTQYTLTYDYNLPEYISNFDLSTLPQQTVVNSGECVTLPNIENECVNKHFLGWYAGDTANDLHVTNQTKINSNFNLVARWNEDYFAQQAKYAQKWNFEFSDKSDINVSYYGKTSDLFNSISSGAGNQKVAEKQAGYKVSVKTEYLNSKELTVPDFYCGAEGCYKVNYLADNAFKDCVNLTKINMNGHIQVIGDSAFKNCTSLTEFDVNDGVISVSGAFQGSSIEILTLPNSIKAMNNCCYGLTTLQHVVFGNEIQSIDDGAFFGCANLESINGNNTFSENTFNIGNWAFAGCSKLQGTISSERIDGILPEKYNNKFISIGDHAFDGCSLITDLDFYSYTFNGVLIYGVNKYGDYCFKNTGLTYLHVDLTPDIGVGIIDGCENISSLRITNLDNPYVLPTFEGKYWRKEGSTEPVTSIQNEGTYYLSNIT